MKLFVLLFGAASFENSALDWTADHRIHHKHVDEDDDPYDISKGFFYAHIGWLLFRETDAHYLWRELTTLPDWGNTFDRSAGRYLFFYTVLYSLPLWINSIWEVFVSPRLALRDETGAIRSTPWIFTQAAIAGVLFAALLVFHSQQSLDFIYFKF